MQTIYNIIFAVIMVVISPFYMIKLWRRGDWQKGFGQRFGKFDHKIKQAVTNSHVVWIHGVSVGEANIAINLVQKLEALKPLIKFVVSCSPLGVVLLAVRDDATDIRRSLLLLLLLLP